MVLEVSSYDQFAAKAPPQIIMQGFFAQMSQTLATEAAAALMEDGTQLACLMACFFLGQLTMPLILRTFGPKSCGAAKIVDDETSEDVDASAGGHPGLALLLEHYGVFDAPFGSWSGCDETVENEPSVDETYDYFQAALAVEACAVGAEASRERHPTVPGGSADATSGLTLLEHYGVFGAPCGSWSCRYETSESEPSLDEVSDYFQAAFADKSVATH